jgi:hypothetical protein
VLDNAPSRAELDSMPAHHIHVITLPCTRPTSRSRWTSVWACALERPHRRCTGKCTEEAPWGNRWRSGPGPGVPVAPPPTGAGKENRRQGSTSKHRVGGRACSKIGDIHAVRRSCFLGNGSGALQIGEVAGETDMEREAEAKTPIGSALGPEYWRPRSCSCAWARSRPARKGETPGSKPGMHEIVEELGRGVRAAAAPANSAAVPADEEIREPDVPAPSRRRSQSWRRLPS